MVRLLPAVANNLRPPISNPHFCAQTIRPLMDEVRQYADALEGEVANELWSYPTYQEMLFIK